MKNSWLIAGWMLLNVANTFAQSKAGPEPNCQKDLESVEKAFSAFITDSIKSSDFYFRASGIAASIEKACTLDGPAKRAVAVKRSILNLYGYFMLDDQESRLFMSPADKKKFFEYKLDSLRNITDSSFLVYVEYINGYYYSFMTEDYRLAMPYLRKAIGRRPGWGALLETIAWAYLWDEKGDSAKMYIDKCIAANPKYPQAYVTAGHVAGKAKNINKALDYFHTALSIDPSSRGALLGIGYWYDLLGKVDSARYYYNLAMKRSPGFLMAYTNLARLETTENAISLYEKCLEINPYQPDVYKSIGDLLNDQEEYEKKRMNYEMAVALDSSYLYVLGILEHNRHNYKEAIDIYKKSLLYNRDKWTYRNIGVCYSQLGDYQQSVFYFEKALELDSTYVEAHYRLAGIYDTTSLQDKQKAKYHYQQVFLANPSSPGLAQSSSYNSFAALDSFLSGSQYYLRAALNTLEDGDTLAAFNIFYDGYINGCDSCLAYANSLMYEHGFNNVEPDYEEAKEWYSYILRRDNADLAWNSLMKLYETHKINADYELWKKSYSGSEQKISLICVNDKDKTESEQTVTIYDYYPEGIHPLLWEGLRLKKEYNATFLHKQRQEFQDWYQQSQSWGYPFAEYAEYYIEANIESKEKDLFERSVQQIEQEKNNTKKIPLFDALVDHLDSTVKKLPSRQAILELASQAYFLYGKFLNETGREKEALQKFKIAIQHDPSDTTAINTSARIRIARSGNNVEELIRDCTVDEKIIFVGYYFDKQDKKSADVIYNDIVATDKRARIRERLYRAYLLRGYDYFDDLFLRDPAEASSYQAHFLGASRSAVSYGDKKLEYQRVMKLEEMMLKTDDNEAVRIEMARDYNSLGWYALLSKDFVTAKSAITRGLELDKNNLYLQGNMPHVLLFNGKTQQAKEMYLKLKDRPFDKTSSFASFREAFLDDFETFKKQKISHPDMEMIIKSLNKN